MKHLISVLLLVLCPLVGSSQELRRFRLQSWNVENLFDTLHDHSKDDRAFMPDGEYRWDSARYWRKQGNLARVILEAGGLQPVDVIALCEVENDSVLLDLTRRTRLAALGYDWVMTESRDLRGVDVALLYQSATFRLIGHGSHRVDYDSLNERPTRDILHCTGVIPTGDTLDVIAVHFPSRRGGVRATAPYRLRAAGVVIGIADSIRAIRSKAAIIVMGDCNDEPSSPSLRSIAEAGFRNLSAEARVDDARRLTQNGTTAQRRRSRHKAPAETSIRGTYHYQRAWSRIDNILVSSEACDRYRATTACIFAPSYLLEADSEGFPVPFRTYRGPNYHGGVSDHLPLLLDLWY